MADLTDDDLFLDLIETVTLDVLHRLGDDPAARHTFFRRFLALAQEVAGSRMGAARPRGCDLSRRDPELIGLPASDVT